MITPEILLQHGYEAIQTNRFFQHIGNVSLTAYQKFAFTNLFIRVFFYGQFTYYELCKFEQATISFHSILDPCNKTPASRLDMLKCMLTEEADIDYIEQSYKHIYYWLM